jgi:FkbM family methyltransferase
MKDSKLSKNNKIIFNESYFIYFFSRIHNVVIPYFYSFYYRLCGGIEKIYDIEVSKTKMKLKLFLRVSGICKFPIIDTMLLRRLGLYEPETSVVLESTLRSGDMVLELGAAEGYFTVQMSKYVGESGKIFSFEPNLSFYQDCIKNLQLNNCDNVEIKNIALSGSSNTLIDGFGFGFTSKPLGDYLSEIEKPLNFIFIDVDAKTVNNNDARQEKGIIEEIFLYIKITGNRPSVLLEYILIDSNLDSFYDGFIGLGYKLQIITKRHYLFYSEESNKLKNDKRFS